MGPAINWKADHDEDGHYDAGNEALRVTIASGTGNPYMTTDTAAALRAIELGCEVLLMTKNNVDGVYSADPLKDANAKKFDHLTYMQALNLRLAVMDSTALSLCLDNKLPVIVFNLQAERSIERAICGEHIGTIINGTSETSVNTTYQEY